RVTTYGQIAAMIPPPEGVPEDDYKRLAPRWVGQAMNKVSAADSGLIPWWRVVNGRGSISLPEGSRAALQQINRLKREEVIFDAKEHIDLAVFGWAGPPATWCAEQGLRPAPALTDPPDPDTPRQLSLF
ncbi:MAG: MGMT family protein, partial [Anaerolineales bacterium]